MGGTRLELLGTPEIYKIMADVTKQMKAMAIDQYGGPEALTLHTLPVPEVGENEVLIRVEVAGVGVWDPMEREGKLIMGETYFPRTLGAEGAGTIASVGGQVTDFKEGDKVYGFGFQSPKGGFYAEYIVLLTNLVSRFPQKLSIEEAGALPVDGVTGLCGLEALQLSDGQKILIWGASGGIGHLVVQLSKRLGAKVFAVASGSDGVEFVQKLGADEAVDGKGGDVVAQAREFAPDGFDAALILAGGDEAQAALETIKDGGAVAFPHGVAPEPKPRATIKVHAYSATPNPQIFERLNTLIEQGPFEVAVARTYPLEEAATAQQDLKGHFLGKLALTV
ncbi:alcohol dehydrogenase [Abditibacteriota bacterium]|nr:alcohol dehydrogenase [Abditibacteriota bacterium]